MKLSHKKLSFRVLYMGRAALVLSLLTACGKSAEAQFTDRAIGSAAGASIGELGGIIGALPLGCGGVFSDHVCHIPDLATGFAIGNLLGSTIGASALGDRSSCSPSERLSRAFLGSLVGGGVGLAAVSRTRGNLRIGLSPLVQVAEAVGAAATMAPCKRLNTPPDIGVIDARARCNLPAREISRDLAAAGMAGGYAALHIYLNREWWSQTPARWFIANDWDQNERDEDKFGHFLGGYQLTRVTSAMLEAGCVTATRAAVIGALYAWAFQFQIEEWDGTQKIYGFNPSDLVADAAGALFSVAQQQSPALRYVKPTFSYRPSKAYFRRNLPGHFGQPRATTDYAGQSYWFSTDVHSLLPEHVGRWWPAFVRLSPGYSITDYIDPGTGAPRRARRKILLSLDLDPEKLPGDNKVWRTLKHELSFLHIPGPTLQLTPNTKWFVAY